MRGVFKLLALLAVCTVPARSESVVIPNGSATTTGNGGYGFVAGFSATFQQVYGANSVSGIPLGAKLIGFSLRQELAATTIWPPTDITVSNFDVYLGTSDFHPGSLSNSVAANEGADTINVRNGPLTLDANSFPGGGNPNGFGPTIDFTSPYTYVGGDLLLTLTYTDPSGSIPFDAQLGSTDTEARQELSYNSTTVPVNVPEYALIVQFEYQLASVPEPSTLALACVAVLIGPFVVRRQSVGTQRGT